jgi:hypothetical protein
MWRIALFCSVLTLTAACGDGPGAPTVNTDEPLLVEEGDPPPPPLDGEGTASFSPSGSEESIDATESVTQQVCVPPTFAFDIAGNYFQNKTEKFARVYFTPVPGSGAGTIHETANNLGDPIASGTLVVIGSDGLQHEIHLLEYNGTSLFTYQRGNFFGSIGGSLVAEVMACGEQTAYTGTITFRWFCFECGKDF